MAIGLRLPVGVDPSGGTAVSSGDDQADKVIRVALMDCDSENAFQQDLGLGSGMVFDVQSQALRGRILARLTQIFRQFEVAHLFKLNKNSIAWEQNSSDQTLTLSFTYVNLESDQPVSFKQTFTAQS